MGNKNIGNERPGTAPTDAGKPAVTWESLTEAERESLKRAKKGHFNPNYFNYFSLYKKGLVKFGGEITPEGLALLEAASEPSAATAQPAEAGVSDLQMAYDAATKGEWRTGGPLENGNFVVCNMNALVIAECWKEPNQEFDAAFITLAHNETPKLLAELAHLRTQLAAAESEKTRLRVLCYKAANAMEYDMRMCAVDSDLLAQLWEAGKALANDSEAATKS